MARAPADEASSIEIDGLAPTPGQLATISLDSYGHFTAMQVRDHRVRGLARHQARLSAAHLEMFGTALDTGKVIDHIRHALTSAAATDASVRVYVRQYAGIMVTVRPPGLMPAGPWRLRSVPYQRPVAHIKHLSDFGQAYFQRQAHAAGFDEALLTSQDGVISEGSITNLGCFDGTEIIWPSAPVLAGITMQVLSSRLAAIGLTSRRAEVRLSDLGSFQAVFVTNARGIASVGQVDNRSLPVDAKLMSRLTQAYESADWDLI